MKVSLKKELEKFLKGNIDEEFYFCMCSDTEIKSIIKVLKYCKRKFKSLNIKCQKHIAPLMKVIKELSKKSSLKTKRKICSDKKIRKLITPLLNKVILPKLLK